MELTVAPAIEENEIGEKQPRKLVTIQRVTDVLPIEGADAIECIKVLGWYLVSKKGEFFPGDLCVFFEVDSILPEHEVFEFMRSRKFRVKTQKFRGQISQGLALRIDEVLPLFGQGSSKTHNQVIGCEYFPFNKELPQIVLEVGADVTEAIGVTKYDPEGESLVSTGSQKKMLKPSFKHKYWLVRRYREYKYHGMRFFYRSKLAKMLGLSDPFAVIGFPSFIPKTDETRVQNLAIHLKLRAGDLCYITEKCEGQSLTAFRNGKEFGICSRNLDMTKEKNSNWVKMNEKYGLFDLLAKQERDYAIQAEIIGPGVQENIYELAELEIRVFYVYDIKAKRKLNLLDFVMFCDINGLPTVPILETGYRLPDNVDAVVGLADGKSVLNPKVLREGIVIVNAWEDYQGQPYSFKAISPKYELLREEKLEKKRKAAEKAEAMRLASLESESKLDDVVY